MRTVRTLVTFALAMSLTLAAAGAAHALQQYAVAPFVINGPSEYAYLSEGVQDMLTTRLHTPGELEAVSRSAMKELSPIAALDTEAAAQAKQRLGAEYFFWGSATVLGDSVSLDLQMLDPQGAVHPKSATVHPDQVIRTLANLARQSVASIVGSPQAPDFSESASEPSQRRNAMNPGLVQNEVDRNTEFYLNPQFRYAGDAVSEGRLRTNSLPFAASGMVPADADGDGIKEVFLMEDGMIHAYEFTVDNRLEPITIYETKSALRNVYLSAIDVDNDGSEEIVVSSMRVITKGTRENYEQYSPESYILDFDGQQFSVLAEKLPYHLKAVPSPPDFEPKLLGQRIGRHELFDTAVYEVIRNGPQFVLGSRVFLPKKANVYNVAYLPQEERYKIILIDERDHLLVYTHTGDRQAKTDQSYSGSSQGLVMETNPMGIDDEILLRDQYYVPLRMIPFNIDGDQRHELLVNHPISVAAQFFPRFRHFPEGEVQSLYWDGVGMNLVWKTRRIKGGVADIALDDINNDGVLDLAVLVNTHPGALGLGNRRSMLLVYPLDVSQQSGEIDSQFLEQ